MLDPAPYIELLNAVRQYVSLSNLAGYLGSKPQNIAGWMTAKSVPHLREFRPRLVELAFFIVRIKGLPLTLGKGATALVDDAKPLLPPWEVAPILEQSVVSTVLEALMPGAKNEAKEPRRPPHFTWVKLSFLNRIVAVPGSVEKPAVSTVLILGETCAGKSALANALVGGSVFPISAIPESPQLRAVTTDTRALVEVPGYDGPAPLHEEGLALLRHIYNARTCRSFVVLPASSFPLISRPNFVESLAPLPGETLLVFSKLDHFAAGADRESAVLYLQSQFPRHKAVFASLGNVDEHTLGVLREHAGLVGTERFKILASIGKSSEAPRRDDSEIFARLAALVAALAPERLAAATLTPETTLDELQLSDAQLGQLILRIEATFGIGFPDRDADLVLTGKPALSRLVRIVATLGGR
jgi:GTP-binding protein EngB required for normal cell division/acyl carrier protein